MTDDEMKKDMREYLQQRIDEGLPDVSILTAALGAVAIAARKHSNLSIERLSDLVARPTAEVIVELMLNRAEKAAAVTAKLLGDDNATN